MASPLVCCLFVVLINILLTSADTEDICSYECGHVKIDRSSRVRRAQSRIVGGREAKRHSWPWICNFRFAGSDSGNVVCGCSVLSRSWIVSAGHCFYSSRYPQGVNISRYDVVIGDHISNVNDGTEVRLATKRLIMHANYSHAPHPDNDIALVELDGELTFNDHIQPICLPTTNTSYETCYVAGWGDTKGTADKRVLQELEVPIIPNDKCRENAAYAKVLNDHMICAGFMEGGHDACQGDSGGPFMCESEDESFRYYLAGVVSFGFGCAAKGFPGVYTDIKQYVPWILEETGLTCSTGRLA